MNRQRKTNKGLPRRVYVKSGAYRFLAPEPMRVPWTGKVQRWVHLAYVHEGESAMLAQLSVLLGSNSTIEGMMPWVCAEFAASKLDRYGEDTQKQYRQFLKVIADEFEDIHAKQVTTKLCADFLRLRFKGKANTAQKYAALMRKVFKYVISELGIRQDNPIDQLDLSSYETRRREVLATHEQIQAIRAAGMRSIEREDTGTTFATLSGPMFACIIDMAYLLWARALDIRNLKESQIVDGYIRIKPSKTIKTSGKVVDIAVTPAILDVIFRAREIKKRYEVISPYLFPTSKGVAYTKSGLSSMWKRAKLRSKITADVTFKDIRALGATDAARRGDAHGDIQKRLAHTSGKTTDIYIKEAIPDVSEIEMTLPWSGKDAESSEP